MNTKHTTHSEPLCWVARIVDYTLESAGRSRGVPSANDNDHDEVVNVHSGDENPKLPEVVTFVRIDPYAVTRWYNEGRA